MAFSEKDFPFLEKKIRYEFYDLDYYVYRHLYYLNDCQHFTTKESLLSFLKGRDERFFLTRRGFGIKSFWKLKDWTLKQLLEQ